MPCVAAEKTEALSMGEREERILKVADRVVRACGGVNTGCFFRVLPKSRYF